MTKCGSIPFDFVIKDYINPFIWRSNMFDRTRGSVLKSNVKLSVDSLKKGSTRPNCSTCYASPLHNMKTIMQ